MNALPPSSRTYDASEQLRQVIVEPQQWTVESVLGTIGSVAATFHEKLRSFDSGNGAAKGWGQELWGPEMQALAAENYRLMAASLLRVTAAKMDQLECGEAVNSLHEEVTNGLTYLRRYKQQGMPVDQGLLDELTRRHEQHASSL